MRILTRPRLRETGRGRTFEDFFEENFERVLRAVYLMTGDRYEAEDIAQEAFVRMLERWDRIANVDNQSGYVYRTAVRLYLNRRRRIAYAAKRTLHLTETDAIAESDDRDEIRRALAALPTGQREAVVLVGWIGMSNEEAARLLGVSAGAVRVRISRARQLLRTEGGASDE